MSTYRTVGEHLRALRGIVEKGDADYKIGDVVSWPFPHDNTYIDETIVAIDSFDPKGLPTHARGIEATSPISSETKVYKVHRHAREEYASLVVVSFDCKQEAHSSQKSTEKPVLAASG